LKFDKEVDSTRTDSQPDTATLGDVIPEQQWEEEVLEAIKKYVELEKKKRLYLSKVKES
jgi:hypothetical protein